MTDERRLVIPLYALELRHLVEPKAKLVVHCRACRTWRDVDVLPVYHALGPAFSVTALEKKLRCGGCGVKGFAMVRVEWL